MHAFYIPVSQLNLMDEYTSYQDWSERVLDENDEFSYRYIYDAYLLAKSARPDCGMYFQLSEDASGMRMEDNHREYVLLLPDVAACGLFLIRARVKHAHE